MKQATLCFLVDVPLQRILLGMKKRGFGQGKYNGFGGKVNSEETIEQAALRELHEESSLSVQRISKAAELTFHFSTKPEWDQIVHVYLAENWEGHPQESDEMKPEWFSWNSIPFDQMWKDDSHWLPLILQGKKLRARFVFGEDNENIIQAQITENQQF